MNRPLLSTFVPVKLSPIEPLRHLLNFTANHSPKLLSGGPPPGLHQIFRLYLSVGPGGLGGLSLWAVRSFYLKDCNKNGPTIKRSQADLENQVVRTNESGNEEYIVLQAIEIGVAFNHVSKSGGFNFFYQVAVENVLVPETIPVAKPGELVYQYCLESFAK